MKRFNFETPKQPEPQKKTAVGFKVNAVQREHILMIAHIWHKWVSSIDPEITAEIAAGVWEHFKANPACQRGDVVVMKRLSNYVWHNWIETN